jgi:hypothetical protein
MGQDCNVTLGEFSYPRKQDINQNCKIASVTSDYLIPNCLIEFGCCLPALTETAILIGNAHAHKAITPRS